MRRKATAKQASGRAAQGNITINIKAKNNTPLRLIKHVGKPPKIQTGRGLGKAGAKRLGRLLKRAIQDRKEPAGKRQASVPKTPVRLFKHQIQSEAENASKTNTAQTNPASHPISQLILSVVSQCKHRGGISMAELKQTLVAGGYEVTKKNRRVNTVTKRLVDNVTLVRTTRNMRLKLNNKTDTLCVRTSTVKSPKQKRELRQSKATSKSPKRAEKSQRQPMKTKLKGKSQKPKRRKNRQAAKTHKPTGNTRKPAGKSQKLKGRTQKTAGRSHKSRRTPKARKSRKPAGKKCGPKTKQPTGVRKGGRKTQRTLRHQPKKNQQAYKYSQKKRPPRMRRPKKRA